MSTCLHCNEPASVKARPFCDRCLAEYRRAYAKGWVRNVRIEALANIVIAPGTHFAVGITGSRTWSDIAAIHGRLDSLNADSPVTYLAHGCAAGADAIADEWANSDAHGVIAVPFPPDNPTRGALLGRNGELVDWLASVKRAGADTLLLAFLTKESRGTWHAVGLAKKAGITVEVIRG